MWQMTRREFGLGLIGSAGLPTEALVQTGAGAMAEAQPQHSSLTDVPGVKAGHFTDSRRPTGCTALIFDEGATAGVDYDGSAPGETQVVLLQPVSPVEKIHALLLTGGGPMGLAAAGVWCATWKKRRLALTGAFRASASPSSSAR